MPRTEAGKALAILVPGNYSDLVATIDAIEREAALPDRDALARALHPATCWNNEFGCMGVEDHFDEADAIIAALKEQE